MSRLVALAFAGLFDTIGSAASAFGDYCLASANAISDALEAKDKEERRRERNQRALDRARVDIERIPVTK